MAIHIFFIFFRVEDEVYSIIFILPLGLVFICRKTELSTSAGAGLLVPSKPYDSGVRMLRWAGCSLYFTLSESQLPITTNAAA